MTDTKKINLKKILSIIGNTLIWLFVVFSVVITILVFAAQGNKDGIPEVFGKSLITIVSPSMEPVYKVGDLILMEKLDDTAKQEVKEGQIITYRAPIDINGDGQIGDINTHRIETIDAEKGEIVTKGDNNAVADNYTIGYNDIIGTSQEDSRIGGVGAVIGFLRTSLGFFVCVVLPLILFFVYELYRFIAIIVSERAKKAPVSKETEEEIKRKAIEEYLKSQEETSQEPMKQEAPEASEDVTE